jgi:hypothetical protein
MNDHDLTCASFALKVYAGSALALNERSNRLGPKKRGDQSFPKATLILNFITQSLKLPYQFLSIKSCIMSFIPLSLFLLNACHVIKF